MDNVPDKDDDPNPTEPDTEINAKGVFTLLRKIKPNKATGTDKIPGKLLKEQAVEIAQG